MPSSAWPRPLTRLECLEPFFLSAQQGEVSSPVWDFLRIVCIYSEGALSFSKGVCIPTWGIHNDCLV